MSNGTIRDDALDPFLIKMGLLGNPETMPPTHVQQRGLPRTTAASLGISDDIFETFGDIKEMIRKGKLELIVPLNRIFHLNYQNSLLCIIVKVYFTFYLYRMGPKAALHRCSKGKYIEL